MDEDELRDKENKREGLEQINVKELTGEVLKVCNILRDKNHKSKMLFKKTGIVCGARYGANAVNQPILLTHDSRAKSVQGLTRFKQVELNGRNQSQPDIVIPQ